MWAVSLGPRPKFGKKKHYQKPRRKRPMHLNKLSNVAALLWTFSLTVIVNKYKFCIKKKPKRSKCVPLR